MFNTNVFKECVISFSDDCQFTGKECYIKSVSVEINNHLANIIPYRRKKDNKYVTGPRECKVSIEMLIKDFNWAFGNGLQNKKIRNKKVENCTIEELLFAVREKIKGN